MSIHNVPHPPGITGDVTRQAELEREIVRLNNELQERARLLEDNNKALESLASTASHDLRSRLSVIGAYAGLLEKHYGDALDARGMGFLSTIRRNVKRTGSLVEDLLSFSRCQRKALELVTVDMEALARGVANEAVRALPDDHPPPSVTVGSLPPARADAAMLRVVWKHLVSNAIKYSRKRPAPSVEISAQAEGGFCVYSVRDNGVGFNMAHAGKLFEAFQRMHDSEEFEGTGLGLAAVRQIVARHGGRVWADSTEGEGAAFCFTLPGAAP